MEITEVKAAVVGAGASGLGAAISCSETLGKGSTVLLEKQNKAGRKLLATGNGRCNISNENISAQHYHGDVKLISSVLSEFPVTAMREFMRKTGVLLRSDSEGRIYPYSNHAATVLDALQNECLRQNAEIKCGFHIKSIKKDGHKFIIQSESSEIRSEHLIFASGSAAAPQLGADESGCSLLGQLGIKHTPLFPALCPVITKEKRKKLKGVRAKGCVSLFADGKKINEQEGEIQFTENGISGICVFQLSRQVSEFLTLGTADGIKRNKLYISADLMKEYSFPEICEYLNERKKLLREYDSAELLSGALNRQLSQTLAQQCGLSGKPCQNIDNKDIKKLAGTVKSFVFTPTDTGGLKSAQVCAGGVGSDEVIPQTLRAGRIKNLYICGELLNVDGDCGGFNLHFALGSGLLAGKLQ